VDGTQQFAPRSQWQTQWAQSPPPSLCGRGWGGTSSHQMDIRHNRGTKSRNSKLQIPQGPQVPFQVRPEEPISRTTVFSDRSNNQLDRHTTHQVPSACGWGNGRNHHYGQWFVAFRAGTATHGCWSHTPNYRSHIEGGGGQVVRQLEIVSRMKISLTFGNVSFEHEFMVVAELTQTMLL
jgi:hypothetical protein